MNSKHKSNDKIVALQPEKFNWKLFFICVAVVAVIFIFIFSNRTETKNPIANAYCGDGVCNSNENKCTCNLDCGSCYRNEGCSQYSCDLNSQCVVTSTNNNCCGNGKCEVGENCISCSSDCGQCSKVTSSSDAVEKLKTRTDIVKDWETSAKNMNCGSRYLDINSAVYFVARVTASQNLIECNSWNSFGDITKLTDFKNKDINDKLRSCDKSLIESYSKAVRGYASSQLTTPLKETCDSCDDFYAIYLGCVNADVDMSQVSNQDNQPSSGISIYQSREATAFAVVDAKTGAVYW